MNCSSNTTLLTSAPLRAGMFPPIHQSRVAILLHPLSPPPHRPILYPQNLRRLPPRDPLRHRLHDHFLYLHCSLHCGFPVLPFLHVASVGSKPPAHRGQKRTFHVLIHADISCANDSMFGTRIDGPPPLCYAFPRTSARTPSVPLFLSSSMAEHPAVNRRVVGSSPT